MKTIFRHFVICFISCLVIAANPQILAAEDGWKKTTQADIELARKYSYLMSHNQVDKAMEFVAEDVIFADYTWGEQSAVTGKKKLYQAYTSGGSGMHNVTIDERLMFSGQGTVVFHYIFSADVDVGENTNPKDRLHGMTDMVQVLTIKNGKIIRHLDLVNYDSVIPAIEAKAKALVKN